MRGQKSLNLNSASCASSFIYFLSFRSAAAPVAVMAAGAAAPAAAAVVEEKTTFDLILEEIPADKKVRAGYVGFHVAF